MDRWTLDGKVTYRARSPLLKMHSGMWCGVCAIAVGSSFCLGIIFSCDEQLKKWHCHSVCSFIHLSSHPFFRLMSNNGVSRKFKGWYKKYYKADWRVFWGCINSISLKFKGFFKSVSMVVQSSFGVLHECLKETRISSSVSNSIIFHQFCELSLSAKFLVCSKHPSGGWPSLGWWGTILRMVGDNSWQLSPGLSL